MKGIYEDWEPEMIKKAPAPVKDFLVENNYDLFYYAVRERKYDPCDFIEKFMHSETAETYDRYICPYRWGDWMGLMADFECECVNYDIEIKPIQDADDYTLPTEAEKAGWAGYIYRLAHFLTAYTSREIVELIPTEEVLADYYVGHTQSPESWVWRKLSDDR